MIQRGNRRQDVFFIANDRQIYLNILHKNAVKFGIDVWAYCLMNNHVHLIAVPEHGDSFARGFSEIHKMYTSYINKREGWVGHLWQGRFLSFPLDERHLYAAVRYVENNPVRAGLVNNAEDYAWSSAQAHVKGIHNHLLSNCYLLRHIHDWGEYLKKDTGNDDNELIRKHSSTGRPLGDDVFIAMLEKTLDRVITKRKPGPK
jgi:putative transposase